MRLPPTSLLTICGLEELSHHSARGVTHVPSRFWTRTGLSRQISERTPPHHRTTLRFHDAIEPGPNTMLPRRDHVEEILRFGELFGERRGWLDEAHLLVHCHMGISRSTAAMAILMAQSNSDESEDWVFSHLLSLRPQAWPNSLMVEFADTILGRQGRLMAALADLYARQLANRPETGISCEHMVAVAGGRLGQALMIQITYTFTLGARLSAVSRDLAMMPTA